MGMRVERFLWLVVFKPIYNCDLSDMAASRMNENQQKSHYLICLMIYQHIKYL